MTVDAEDRLLWRKVRRTQDEPLAEAPVTSARALRTAIAQGAEKGLGLGLVGLKGGVLVGLLAGLVSFIPYVGSAFGVLLATALGLGQFGMDYVILGQMVAIFLVGQFIEGNFLTPRLVGDRVNLHPVWIIFALLAMGTLFGFLGLLLAVPIAAVIGVLVRFAFMRLLNDETAMVEKD
ncbi:MAG: AI-2E family transporter [Alphaproteobacteria bacterium]|nr:AI-2E family transporter [Alphaproteobacteria bacterium]